MNRERSVLVIEDDPDILELLRLSLERERFSVKTASTGEEGLRVARAKSPALVLLDLGLPRLQGLELLRMMKEDDKMRSLPVVILTAKGEEGDVVVGLELGADDYVTKPFKVKELVARIRAVLRRTESGSGPRPEILEVGPLLIDSARHEVTLAGQRLDFTLAEFRVLRLLAANPGRVLTRDRILNEITDGAVFIIDRNVDVHVRAIRQKLGGHRDFIVTVRGVGYKLSPQNTASS